MDKGRIKDYLRGVKSGLPIGAGYFAVSFTLGILMQSAGISVFQGILMSLTNNTSAGQAAGTQIIMEGGSYAEIAISQLVINLRYFLMSAALAPVVTTTMKTIPRLLISFEVTDEVFALLVSQKRPLSQFFAYGVFSVTIPGWAAGTGLGILFGNILPPDVVNALSVALYAMFIAVIIPPAKENRVLRIVIPVSMAVSFLASVLPLTSALSSGMRIIILTVLLSALFALVAPVKEAEDAE